MNITLEVTVCCVNEDDNHVNFNFISEKNPEGWCLGPIKTDGITNPSVGQKIKIYGNWVNDASVQFQAAHIEQA